METELTTLLETKNFADLTTAEKNLVLATLSETEYNQQRKLILAAQEVFNVERSLLVPNPTILVNAKNKLAERNAKQKKAGVFILFQHKTPTWAAVAACAIILFMFWGFQNFVKVAPEKIIITEQIHDTIFSEKLITETVQLPSDTVVKLIYKNAKESQENKIVAPTKTQNYSTSFPIEAVHFSGNEYCNIMSCYESKKGIPIAKDTLLKFNQVSL